MLLIIKLVCFILKKSLKEKLEHAHRISFNYIKDYKSSTKLKFDLLFSITYIRYFLANRNSVLSLKTIIS